MIHLLRSHDEDLETPAVPTRNIVFCLIFPVFLIIPLKMRFLHKDTIIQDGDKSNINVWPFIWHYSPLAKGWLRQQTGICSCCIIPCLTRNPVHFPSMKRGEIGCVARYLPLAMGLIPVGAGPALPSSSQRSESYLSKVRVVLSSSLCDSSPCFDNFFDIRICFIKVCPGKRVGFYS